MTLTWYGHACFRLGCSGASLIFDPYAPGSVPGLSLPPDLAADRVLCSHGHRDHGYAQGVTLSGKGLRARLTRIPCFHDEAGGAKRGDNLITVLEAEGLRLAHLGDLGHMLSAEQLAALGKVDILLIPVGGFYTIDAHTAWALVEAIRPAVTVPMHYRGTGFGYDVIGPVEDFLAHAERVTRLDGNVLEPEKLETPTVALLKCPVGE